MDDIIKRGEKLIEDTRSASYDAAFVLACEEARRVGGERLTAIEEDIRRMKVVERAKSAFTAFFMLCLMVALTLAVLSIRDNDITTLKAKSYESCQTRNANTVAVKAILSELASTATTPEVAANLQNSADRLKTVDCSTYVGG